MPKTFPPSLPRLGLLGGGQLAKMTAAAAAQLGCEVVVLERQEEFPARCLAAQTLIGDWDDPEVLLRLGSLVDVVSLENEFVSPQALAALAERHPLWPSVATVSLVQDKLHQKQAFAAAGLPVARSQPVASRKEALGFGVPAVLKRRRLGYDGKGNATVSDESDLDAAWEKLDGDQHPLYIEEFCNFHLELATIVTRGQAGEVARYPVVETVNRNHICHLVRAPAAVPAAVAQQAAEIAERAVAAIHGVGSFGLELFWLRDGRLLINEIAPRVHNTGHYTLEACATSQFENHVRAVLGWPLGATTMRSPAAVMVNLLGAGAGSGWPHGVEGALSVPGAHIHIYGKSKSSKDRKMGHITVLGETLEAAEQRARQAADAIRFGGEA